MLVILTKKNLGLLKFFCLTNLEKYAIIIKLSDEKTTAKNTTKKILKKFEKRLDKLNEM